MQMGAVESASFVRLPPGKWGIPVFSDLAHSSQYSHLYPWSANTWPLNPYAVWDFIFLGIRGRKAVRRRVPGDLCKDRIVLA